MAVTVKKAVLWRKELENRPGTLAESLKPFADASANLQVVMGYVFPGDHSRAALEVYPVGNRKAEQAAAGAGMKPFSEITCLIVEGNDRVGLGYEIAAAIGKAGINANFACIQVVARRYTGVFGFHSNEDADLAAKIIKGIKSAGRKAATGKKATKKAAAKKSTGKAAKGGRKATAAKASAKSSKKGGKKSTTKKAQARAGAKKAGAKKTSRRK